MITTWPDSRYDHRDVSPASVVATTVLGSGTRRPEAAARTGSSACAAPQRRPKAPPGAPISGVGVRVRVARFRCLILEDAGVCARALGLDRAADAGTTFSPDHVAAVGTERSPPPKEMEGLAARLWVVTSASRRTGRSRLGYRDHATFGERPSRRSDGDRVRRPSYETRGPPRLGTSRSSPGSGA